MEWFDIWSVLIVTKGDKYMSKAILVMDMPDCCADCPCSFFERSNPKLNWICGIAQEDANNIGKPEWCPLQTPPLEEEYSDCFDEFEDGYAQGWNDCIEEIFGWNARFIGKLEVNGYEW